MSAGGRRSDRSDFLIVGAGTAGCVLANRLSAGGATVTLLEAGRDTPPAAVPDDIRDTYPRSYYNRAYMWDGLSAEQGADDSGRKTPFPQGRVMGGGGSLMGMMAVRGRPEDYDGWGVPGWTWGEVLPYFRRLEDDWDFDGPLHGSRGPVAIRRHRVEDWPPFCAAVGEAVGARGLPVVEDMNGEFQDGYCRLPISATLTHRVSSSGAYLDEETRRRPNLTIVCDAELRRLLFDGTRCHGAEVRRGDRLLTFEAARVVLSAGAIFSPAILQRSGIGAEDHLRGLGIAPVAVLPGVGENLQNHPVAYLATFLRPAARQTPRLRPQFNAGLRYTASDEVGGDGDMMMLVVNKSSWHGLGSAVAGLGVCLTEPRSRGAVRIETADPATMPDVRFRMYSDPHDRARMVSGMQLALELMRDRVVSPLRHEVFATGYTRVVRRLNQPGAANAAITRLLASVLDGPDIVRQPLVKWGIAGGQIDEERMAERSTMGQIVRQRGFGTYHPAGSCKMGEPGDQTAVVDRRCSVIGVDGLSVVDASIMPTVVRGNTNIPTTMLAERAADLLLIA